MPTFLPMTARYRPSNTHDPVTWIHGHPIYAAHLVVIIFIVSMLVTTVLMAAGVESLFVWLPFDSAAVWKGEVWRIFTYGLLNPPSIPFAIDMVLIAWFGRELEKVLGRFSFLRFFGCLYLLSPVLFTALGPWHPLMLAGETGALAVFIAFATFYPGAVIFFNLLAWWVAAILVGIYTLIAISDRNDTALLSLWSTVGFAYAYVRHAQGRLTVPGIRIRRGRRRSEARKVQSRQDATRAELDTLLDKIAASGMASLTPEERARLDAARSDLLKRSRGGQGR